MKTLTTRQRDVLRALVEEYIRTAEPVGSRTLSRMEGFGLSPATLRNEMADLEVFGYIAATHHSSGRMPTVQGLRYYVDHLLDVERLRREEEEKLSDVRKGVREKRTLLKNALLEFSRALSELTRYPGLLLLADPLPDGFRKVQFLRIDEGTLLVTLVSTVGAVTNHTIRGVIPDQETLHTLARSFNDQKGAFTAAELEEALDRLLAEKSGGVSFDGKSLYNEALFIEGMLTLLDHKEFRTSPERIARVFELLETKSSLARVLASFMRHDEEGPQVRIGSEVEGLEDLDLSIAGTPVSCDGRSLGMIGIVGPSRMEYGRVLGLLERMAKSIRDMRTDPDGG